jgi:predicted RNA-binding Zn-ribbon protein involved in translation (DUF1610 family)
MKPNIALEATKYDCPNCHALITTAQYKAADHTCPNCSVKLEQVREKNTNGAGFKYSFSVIAVIGADTLRAPEKPKLYIRTSLPDVRPLVFKLKDEYIETDNPDYIVTYVNIPLRQTELHCPNCGSYALTTGLVGGGNVKYGPCMRKNDGAKCKAIVQFEFVRSNDLLLAKER